MSGQLIARYPGFHDGFQLLQVGGKLASDGPFHDEHEDSYESPRVHTHIGRRTAIGILGALNTACISTAMIP
jgi:hypothetical protein